MKSKYHPEYLFPPALYKRSMRQYLKLPLFCFLDLQTQEHVRSNAKHMYILFPAIVKQQQKLSDLLNIRW